MASDIYKNYTSVAVFSNEQEEAQFSAWGELYFRERILPNFPSDKNANILEIGCGYGRYLSVLTKLGYTQTYGIDISEEQIRYAQQHLGLTNVEKADALNFLTTHAERYHVVMLLDVVEHLTVDYAVELLTLVREYLHPEGRLIIQVPNAMAPMTPNYHGDITHTKLYSTRTMGQLLMMSGFQQFNHYELPPIPHGLKSKMRALLWKSILKPAIKSFLLASNGEAMGGIYTSNFLTVATK
uniref:Class I SAM-dependent methyltransferase n=1 Tax=Roseihalotalea indica TaxID=2867963 RepID=A0AA49JJZ7_9BACT|nr:class I SAM-dependent methyltransferase [Tunicatimonas sp. TK19036]